MGTIIGTLEVRPSRSSHTTETLKLKVNGSIKKARGVGKSFTQTYSIDYLETFAVVAKLNSTP